MNQMSKELEEALERIIKSANGYETYHYKSDVDIIKQHIIKQEEEIQDLKDMICEALED